MIAPTPTTSPSRSPLPPGCEIYLVCEPRHWRGELHDGRTKLEARGDSPEAVVADLVRLYQNSAEGPLLA